MGQDANEWKMLFKRECTNEEHITWRSTVDHDLQQPASPCVDAARTKVAVGQNA
jgi:hypothetical protein